MFGFRRVWLQLLAQLQNLVVNSSCRWVGTISTYLIEQSLARKQALRIFGEEFQQLELMSSEDDRTPIASNRHSLEVDFALRESINRRQFRLPLPPDSRLNASRKLTRTKRLRHIIVGTQLEEKYLIRDLRNCAEDDDRDFAQMALERLAEITSGNPRKDQIQDHSQRPLGKKQLQPSLTVTGDRRDIALFREDSPKYLLHAWIVFNDKNRAEVCCACLAALGICRKPHVLDHHSRPFRTYRGRFKSDSDTSTGKTGMRDRFLANSTGLKSIDQSIHVADDNLILTNRPNLHHKVARRVNISRVEILPARILRPL